MTREEYLKMRNSRSIDYVYEFYKEKCDKDKELDYIPFIHMFNAWSHAPKAIDDVTLYYDHMFEITKVENLKTGQIIKFL